MKKEILLHWFGDNKPKYVDWNVQNFKKMNPNWDIKFVEYSLHQIQNPCETRDKLLRLSIQKSKESKISPSVLYRDLYLQQFNDDGFCATFDLDCFPIAPLDDFFINSNVQWMANGPADHMNSHYRGYWIVGENLLKTSMNRKYIQQKDVWFSFRINNPIGDRYCYKDLTTIQVLKTIDMNKTLKYYGQFLINDENIFQQNTVDLQKENFKNCKLQLGTSICNKYLTPVEHYNLTERFQNNNNV